MTAGAYHRGGGGAPEEALTLYIELLILRDAEKKPKKP
jgi:hypothetical protein